MCGLWEWIFEHTFAVDIGYVQLVRFIFVLIFLLISILCG